MNSTVNSVSPRATDQNHVAFQYSKLIEQAVAVGIENYIRRRKEKVSEFVETHFSFGGALQLHKKALGKDLYRAPLNILWMAPLSVVKAVSFLSKKAGADKVSGFLGRVPPGFQTEVQKEVNWLMYTELLELPYKQGSRESGKDALLEEILNVPEISEIIEEILTEISFKSEAPEFRTALERNLREYATSRTAASELAGGIITLSSGLVAFQKAVPGTLASGSAAAGLIAEKIAISQFWLGPTVGAWYYSLFPATASTGLVIAATGSIMAGLALITTFTGIITDPLQSKLGLHQKRLNRFLDALREELLEEKKSQYHVKDHYIARVFDIFDLLTIAIKA